MFARARRVFRAALAPLLLAGCSSSPSDDVVVLPIQSNPETQGGGHWGGGGAFFAGGQWGSAGGMFAPVAGQWSGAGTNWGNGNWGAGGSSWTEGAGQFGGRGGFWGSGGGWFAGGSGGWGGGSGGWGGGYPSSFPFVGSSCVAGSTTTCARAWKLDGIPKPGYSAAVPPKFSVGKDNSWCEAGSVRLGGFAYPIDVNGWPSQIALGFNTKLCVPVPAGSLGLTMNPTLVTTSLTPQSLYAGGGYALSTNTVNTANDANAMKMMVGFGTANVATQYGGALCASIGALAAAKRNCAVGIANSDPNHAPDGSLSPRGAVLSAAQKPLSSNTPFGRSAGYGVYGAPPGDMESYANQVLRRYTATGDRKVPPLPTSATDIGAWNERALEGSAYSFTGTDLAALSLSSSTNAAALAANINGATAAPLNLVPVDGVSSTDPDLAKSLQQNNGDLYMLNLHSLATMQSPLYGSGGARWYFKTPANPKLPLMDIASIYQGPTYFLTGQLSGLPSPTSTISAARISAASIHYADWNDEPTTGRLYIDHAAQVPKTITNDTERAMRLSDALGRPRPMPNFGTGRASTCAISGGGGGVKCWGLNSEGELGLGYADLGQFAPVDVPSLKTGIASIVGGDVHTCALSESGTVLCWGDNSNGQVGNGSVGGAQLDPSALSGMTGVLALAAGASHTCAIMADRTVRCWGRNDLAQLGDTGGPDTGIPQSVPGISNAVAITAGNTHTCALLDNSGVKCWGGNYSGQLGRGFTSYNETTVDDVIGLTSGVVDVASHTGSDHTCALLLSGGVRCWGSNISGQIGNHTSDPNNVAPVTSPVSVSGFASSGAISVVTGESHSCLVTVGGGAKCWGSNAAGQLGTGNNLDHSEAPVDVATLTSGVSTVLAGYGHTCARLSNGGGMKCWGDNNSGDLGDGTGEPSNIPVFVQGLVSNGSPIISQGSVLIHKEDQVLAGTPVSGHVTPIPWSMSNSTTGNVSLIVSYDPLAAAAAVFIEQYDAHVNACRSTPIGLAVTQAQQAAGTYLAACADATARNTYLSGMVTLLDGARHYLFGNAAGCIQSTRESVAGRYCPVSITGPDRPHYPYTFVTPGYASLDSGYAAAVASAVDKYTANVIKSTATRLERTLQLAGSRSFVAGKDAIVTTRVVRNGTDLERATTCVLNDGFSTRLQ